MKLVWFSLVVFYAFISQKHLAITAVSTSLPFEESRLTQAQEKLVKDLGFQISQVLKSINTPEYTLDEDDPPLVQNFTSIYEDESLNGNLLLNNIVIEGLSDTDEDGIDVVRDKVEIRMAVNLKQLVIHGEFIYETLADGADEKGTFSVTLTNVRIEGVASLLAHPTENLVITKVVPSVFSEESLVKVKPLTAPSDFVLKSALEHLQNNIKKRFARIAYLEVYMHYPKKSVQSVSMPNWLFEARRYVSQRHDPNKFKMISMGDESSSLWRLGPFRLYGFSNFYLDEIDMVVTNTSVNMIVRVLSEGLRGSFPFFLQQRYTGTYTIAKMDFIGKIKLMVDGSLKVPVVDGLGMEMTGCKCRFRNKATGVEVSENEFGFDAEDLFCLLIRNEVSTSGIVRAIQTEIFNKVDLRSVKERITDVFVEDNLLSV